MSNTPIASLPEISQSQAGKDITHNEALRYLEALSFRVLSRTTTAQPATPADGDTHIIPAGATGTDWANYTAGDVALYMSNAWVQLAAFDGLRLVVLDESGTTVQYTSGAWSVPPVTIPAASVNTSNMSDFDEDSVATTGLTWGWLAGRVRYDNAVTDVAAGTIGLTASTTNYVEMTPAGVVSVNTSAFTSGRIPLRQVVTGASAITTSTDKRAWLSAGGGSGSSSSSIPDFAADAATTTGLTWGYSGGNLRSGNGITVVAPGTVTLTDASTNYVSVSSTGAVSANTTGFAAGQIPLAEVTTSGGAITNSLDRRAWLQFAAGDFQSNGSVPMTGALKMGGNMIEDYAEQTASPASSAGALTIDCSATSLAAITLTESITGITFSNVPATGVYSLILELTQDATGGWSVTWPASIKWPGGTAPTLTTAAGGIDVITLYTRDGGTSWMGFASGTGMA